MKENKKRKFTLNKSVDGKVIIRNLLNALKFKKRIKETKDRWILSKGNQSGVKF